jgi:hypothetical protein
MKTKRPRWMNIVLIAAVSILVIKVWMNIQYVETYDRGKEIDLFLYNADIAKQKNAVQQDERWRHEARQQDSGSSVLPWIIIIGGLGVYTVWYLKRRQKDPPAQ